MGAVLLLVRVVREPLHVLVVRRPKGDARPRGQAERTGVVKPELDMPVGPVGNDGISPLAPFAARNQQESDGKAEGNFHDHGSSWENAGQSALPWHYLTTYAARGQLSFRPPASPAALAGAEKA